MSERMEVMEVDEKERLKIIQDYFMRESLRVVHCMLSDEVELWPDRSAEGMLQHLEMIKDLETSG